MKNIRNGLIYFLFIFALQFIFCESGNIIWSSEHVKVRQDAINTVSITRDGKTLAIYGLEGNGKADMVLFTHSRRDILRPGYNAIHKGAKAIVPQQEAHFFSQPDSFWNTFASSRFHDYEQQTSKRPVKSIPIHRSVRGGDVIHWNDIMIKVLDTPGYTRGAVSYVIHIDGSTLAFVGDLIYGEGKIFDLYSFQDAVPEANIRGYHGWASRLRKLVPSLDVILRENPDFLIPVRGPIIKHPHQAIEKLKERVEAVVRNQLSINAVRWYFGKERLKIMTDPILDSDKNVLWKINAQTQTHLPEWIVPIANSRLILSETKHGFLVDCGSDRIVETLKGLYDNGRFVKLDGVFLTHYHDDHTNRIMAVVEAFDCPVYACSNLVDILKHPKAFRLPAMTSIPIPEISVLKHEQQMNWQEFKFTFYNFPGQTIYHDAMLVEHSLEEPIFFIGDSFSPTGIDDYCLLNRNLLHNDKGYFFCLNLLDRFDYRPLLINQHILPLFRFTQQDLHTIRKTLEERLDLLHDLLPWENPNTGIDERWVRLYPYGQDLKSGETFTIECRLYNHSNNTRDFQIRLYLPEGIKLLSKDNSMTIPARTEKNIQFELHAADNIKAGLHVLTADVIFSWWQLTDWCEALIHITPPEQE